MMHDEREPGYLCLDRPTTDTRSATPKFELASVPVQEDRSLFRCSDAGILRINFVNTRARV